MTPKSKNLIVRERHDVCGMGPLGPSIKLDLSVSLQRSITLHLDRRMVDRHVLVVLALDEPVAFRSVSAE